MDARLRPTFEIPLRGPRDEAVARLRSALAEAPDLAGRWHGKGRWAELHVPSGQMRVWSPCLSVRLDDDGGECRLFGRYGPRPEVWTFFMFVYGLTAFLTLFGLVFGWVQRASGEAAWGLWIPAVGGIVLGLLHIAGWAARRLGRAQILDLRRELDAALDTIPDLRSP